MNYLRRCPVTNDIIKHKPTLKEMNQIDKIDYVIKTYGSEESKNKLKEQG